MEYEINEIEIEKVRPNDWNPNMMDSKKFGMLMKEISSKGCRQPVLVRLKGDMFEIIDGEHRFNACKELGYSKVPCIVVADNDVEAKVSTIMMGKIKGEFNPVKLAKLIEDFAKTYTKKQIKEMTGYSEGEIEDYLLLTGLSRETKEALKQVNEGKSTEVIQFALDSRQREILEKTLINAKSKYDTDRNECLTRICDDWLNICLGELFGDRKSKDVEESVQEEIHKDG